MALIETLLAILILAVFFGAGYTALLFIWISIIDNTTENDDTEEQL